MNIRKTISNVGYPLLLPLSACAKALKTDLTLAEARRIVAEVYDPSHDSTRIGGGGKSLKANKLDISFVIPVYNSERFLERCVLSILNQHTSATYEVICINDGSSDGSLGILNKLQSQYPGKLRVFSQENQGISATRNKGIEEAEGEYIGFIDNDDYVSEGYIEALWQCRKETDADMIQIGFNFVNANGEWLSHSTKPAMVIANDRMEIQKHVSGFVWSGLHRKKAFDKVRFPIGFWYEDMITKMLLTRICHKYAFIERCLYNKRLHDSNASVILWKRNNPKCIDQLYLTMRLTEWGNKEFGLETDSQLFYQIVYEMDQMYRRTRGLNVKVRRALFVIAGDFVKRNIPQEGYTTDNRRLKRIYDDLTSRRFWKYEIDGMLNWFDENK